MLTLRRVDCFFLGGEPAGLLWESCVSSALRLSASDVLGRAAGSRFAARDMATRPGGVVAERSGEDVQATWRFAAVP